MTVPITALFTGLLILWLLRLTYAVSSLRQQHQVSIGNGSGQPELERAIRAHANFIEYIPLALFAMALLEWQGLNDIYLYIFGASLLAGRVLHRKGIAEGKLRARIIGMMLTLTPLIFSSVFLLVVWAVSVLG